MELFILKTIEWKIYVATPMIFLQHVSLTIDSGVAHRISSHLIYIKGELSCRSVFDIRFQDISSEFLSLSVKSTHIGFAQAK